MSADNEARSVARIGPALLLSLLAGRGVFRIVQYGAAIVLLPVWGAAQYGHYAAALGTFLWLTAVTSIGPEKAALKMLSRARDMHSVILGAFLAGVAYLPLPLLAAFLVAMVAGWSESVTLYLAAAALAMSLGCNLLVVGLMRVTGRPRGDALNYFLLAAAYVVLTGAAAVTNLGPVAYIGGQLAVVTILNLDMLRRLGRPSLQIRRQLELARELLWTVGLMGGFEICVSAMTSVLFVLLAPTQWSAQSAVLFPVALAWEAGVNLLFYLQKVFQPRVSLLVSGRGASFGRGLALRLARVVVALSATWLVVAGIVLVTTDVAQLPVGVPLVLALLVILLSKSPSFVLLSLENYLLENIDQRSLRVTVLGSAFGLVGVALLGLVCVPAFGAVGALYATGMMDLVHAGTVLIIKDRIMPPGVEGERAVASASVRSLAEVVRRAAR